MTGAARRAALEAIAEEVRTCTRCRLHETRTRAVPGEGHPETEVVFVGEGPGFNEDREGRPFVGRAGDFLVRLLGSIGWGRGDVFITNVVKCRPPENRDPEPDEIATCGPYLQRQLAVLDPALVVTLGRHSMARFMPGTTISRAHGTLAPVDPATGAAGAMVYAMYHPAAALRSPDVAESSFADAARIPAVLEEARVRRIGAPSPSATASRPDAAAEDSPTVQRRPALLVAPDAAATAMSPGPAGPPGPAAIPAELAGEPATATSPGTAAPAGQATPAGPPDDAAPEAPNQLTLFG